MYILTIQIYMPFFPFLVVSNNSKDPHLTTYKRNHILKFFQQGKV